MTERASGQVKLAQGLLENLIFLLHCNMKATRRTHLS